MEKNPFPFVLIAACVVAVAWQAGHLWVGVAVVAAPFVLFVVPSLIGVAVLTAFMALCTLAYVPVAVARAVQAVRSHA